MRVAVLADVHANRPALEAVLGALEGTGCDRVLCLGDMVGYHAEPTECVRRIRQVADAGVMGNHDWAAVRGEAAAGTNEHARHVMGWTRARLPEDCRDYIVSRPACHLDPAGMVLAHGCYLNEVFHRGYATSTMLEANLRAIEANPHWPKVALCGHTHMPLCGWIEGGEVRESTLREPLTWPVDAAAVLINPGSVGQPRDADPRAAFGVIDLERRRVEVHRVPYDVEETIGALDRAGFARELGARLREGR